MDIPARGHVHDDVVESAFNPHGDGQIGFVHPEHPESAVVGHEPAGRQFVHVFRGKGDAHDAQPFAAAMDGRVNGVTRAESMGLGKRLADNGFATVTGQRKTSGREKKQVQVMGMIVGKGDDCGLGHLLHARDIQQGRALDPGFHRGHVGNAGQASGQDVGGPFEIAEYIGQSVGLVVGEFGRLQGNHQTALHDHDGEPADKDHAHGHHLPLNGGQVAQKFSIQGSHGQPPRT